MEIKQSSPESLSGLYRIVVDDTVVTVYCEMAKEGGGFTFIPREAVIKGKLPQLINQVFKNKTQVLLRIQKKDGLQPFTLITQLPRFTQHNLAVLMHNYNGYTQPQNYYMRDYLFLGVLPKNVAWARVTQGFRSNGKKVTYVNCDGNPNSYFVFYPNHKEMKISSFHGKNLIYESQGVAVDWRNSGVPSYGHRQLPNNFIFLTELLFGGCGTYTSSDRWRDAYGSAIGLR
ncbi:uncharacterized protein LOC124446529 [Xenia sp. Carnegie-2017]|uniref:uncharacterized protein LOC124446529 n=1 Tax=Xenia sp. Carnegie-2017 TaxID=2897299 RepID=UPI001F03D9A0|nr:uncharacterized protein LOC124446529 [Xenia sp. Carnegie-2017]